MGGFHGDLNATYLVGKVDEKGQKLVTNARECLEKAIAAVKPGMKYREFGKIIEAHATANGFSVVRTFCGHGINQLFHCAPNVPHYASKFLLVVLSISCNWILNFIIYIWSNWDSIVVPLFTNHSCYLYLLKIDNKAIGVCKPGHVFTIEPMICEGTWRDELW